MEADEKQSIRETVDSCKRPDGSYDLNLLFERCIPDFLPDEHKAHATQLASEPIGVIEASGKVRDRVLAIAIAQLIVTGIATRWLLHGVACRVDELEAQQTQFLKH